MERRTVCGYCGGEKGQHRAWCRGLGPHYVGSRDPKQAGDVLDPPEYVKPDMFRSTFGIIKAEVNEEPTLFEDGGGLRYDEGKPRYELIPPEALEALADHYRRGALKYKDRNWERGMAWGRCFGSLMRHCWAFWRGETYDRDTGSHHMIAAAWNCFALFTYDERKIGEDDRHKRTTKGE